MERKIDGKIVIMHGRVVGKTDGKVERQKER